MENKVIETTPWSDCPLDIFSQVRLSRPSTFVRSSFRRPLTEVGIVTVRCLALGVNHPGFFYERQAF
jgi:hypothetical protein